MAITTMNPMIRKELRQRMRERRGWILPSLYLVVLGAVICFAYYMASGGNENDFVRGSSGVQGFQIGIALFLTAAFTQLILLLLLAPIFSAGALTIEKEQRTLGALLSSLLGPFQIWWGKFAASLLFVLLLLAAGLPILSAVFAFGGVGLWEVGMVTLTTVLILATVGAVSLYWSSVFRRSVIATAVSYVSVLVMIIVPFIILMIHESFNSSRTWQEYRLAIRIPMYFNPLFFLTSGLVPRRQLYPEWFSCLGIYAAVGILCVVLTLRNIRRSGGEV